MRPAASYAATLLLLLLPACGGDDPNPRLARDQPGLAPQTEGTVDIDSQPLPPRPGTLPARAARIVDTVLVAGMPEAVTARLIHAPADFVVPFSTYVPEGIAAAFDTAAGVDRATFTAAAPGAVENALMLVRIYPAGTTLLEVENFVRELVASRGAGIDESTPMEPPGWAQRALRIAYPVTRSETHTGSAAIAQYGPRFFDVITLYPAAAGVELEPRFTSILEQWRWEDTGLMLAR